MDSNTRFQDAEVESASDSQVGVIPETQFSSAGESQGATGSGQNQATRIPNKRLRPSDSDSPSETKKKGKISEEESDLSDSLLEGCEDSEKG